VIERERKGDYLGRTVQVVPHLTDAVQDWIERVARIPVDDTSEEPDVCIIELGGTVGYVIEIARRTSFVYLQAETSFRDIESGPFIESMRQLRRRAGKDNFLQIHVSYVTLSFLGNCSVVTHLETGASNCRRTEDQTDTAGYKGCSGMLKNAFYSLDVWRRLLMISVVCRVCLPHKLKCF